MGIPYGTYSGHESGLRGIKEPDIERYARFFRVPASWLAFGEGDPDHTLSVPVMGLIGAGAEIHPSIEQVPLEGLYSVDLPFPVPDDMIGLEVRGESMLPRYDDGDVIVVYREPTRPAETFIGEEAAVRTEDDRRFLKIVRRGPGPGLFTLDSWNAKPIEGVRLNWIGEIYVTVRSGQLRRLKQKEKALAARRRHAREKLAAGTIELPFGDEKGTPNV